MRIALIIYGSLETLSGGYLYDRKLVAQLELVGHDVRLFSLPWRSYPRHLADNLKRDFADTIAAFTPHVIIQDELNHPSLFWLNRRLARLGVPIVSIVHHLRSGEEHPAALLPVYRAIEAAYLRSVDGFICNSETTRRNVLALRRSDAPDVVAYPSVGDWAIQDSSSLHEEFNAPAPLRRLLFIGNLIARKQLDVVLRALQNGPRTLTLDVVGSESVDPRFAGEMRTLAMSLQVDQRVRFHGKLDDTALSTLARECDLLLVPSFEGFGIVYLEAMAHGLPVIASNAGAAGEIVQAGENGFLVPLGDAAAITRLLYRLWASPEKMTELRAGARTTFSAFPTWEVSGNRIVEWLEAFVSSWQSTRMKRVSA